jgi:signal transduction histidine kinase
VELNIDKHCSLGMAGEACDNIYRIAQEAATNAIKHARASRVAIDVRRDSNGIRLEVIDDGCGLPESPGLAGGLGLHTMFDRAASIGATLEIVANPGGGTQVVCHVPQLIDQTEAALPIQRR